MEIDFVVSLDVDVTSRRLDCSDDITVDVYCFEIVLSIVVVTSELSLDDVWRPDADVESKTCSVVLLVLNEFSFRLTSWDGLSETYSVDVFCAMSTVVFSLPTDEVCGSVKEIDIEFKLSLIDEFPLDTVCDCDTDFVVDSELFKVCFVDIWGASVVGLEFELIW